MNEKKNVLKRLLVDNEWVIEPKEIVEFDSNLYEEPFDCRPTLEGLQIKCISFTQREELEKDFSKEEVL